MRVGLLTQWYDPEPGPAALPGVLARGLVARGHEVTVLTGFPNYPNGRLAEGYKLGWRQDEIRDGVRVRRTWLYPNHDASSVRRMLNYGSFGASSLLLGVDALSDIDVLWVNYSPITVAPAMWWLRHRHDVPLVVHVLDLWPDTVTAGGFGRDGRVAHLLETGVSAWCRRMYDSASTVVVNSPGVRAELVERGVAPEKLVHVPLWADETTWPAPVGGRQERGDVLGLGLADDDVVLLYAGALGRAQGLEVLLDACAQVRDSRLRCVIAGSGVAEAWLRARAAALRLGNVEFVGRVAPDVVRHLMADADASFVALSRHPLSSITTPSKFQASLAAGRCLVVSADGDLADAAASTGAAFVAAAADSSALAEALAALCAAGRPRLAEMGREARAAYEHRYAARLGIDRIEVVLADATPGKVCSSLDDGLRLRQLWAGDVRAAASLHREAFPDFFLSGLGERFLREFYRGFLSDETAVTTVAIDANDRLVGVAVGTTTPSGFFRRLLGRHVVAFLVASVLAAIRRPSSTLRLLRGLFYRGEKSGDGALLSSICVDPAERGSGVGSHLLHGWSEEAARSGATGAHLTTDARGNDAVNRFYRSHGWVLSGQHTTREGRHMNLYQKSLTS